MTAPVIDGHVHVYRRDLPFAAQRRYTPGADALPETLLALMGASGVNGAVLVQPSVLGTDNAYLLTVLAGAPSRFRGIAVVDPAIDDDGFERLAEAGVVGLRYNLVGADPAYVHRAEVQALSRRAAALGWQIELHADGPDLPAILTAFERFDTPVVVDHFGRPDPAKGVACAGFQRLLAAGADGPIYVKLSAPYRCGGVDVAPYADQLFDRLGPDRLLWGSDWPWTQHGAARSYAACAAMPGTGEPWSKLLAPTAARLFGFDLD